MRVDRVDLKIYVKKSRGLALNGKGQRKNGRGRGAEAEAEDDKKTRGRKGLLLGEGAGDGIGGH